LPLLRALRPWDNGEMRTPLLLLVICAACDSDPETAVDAPGGTPDAAVDAPPDAPPSPRGGWVVIIEQSDGQGAVDSDVDIAFADRSPYGQTIASDGPCTAYDDPVMDTLSAGMVTVAGTTTTVTATPMGTPPDVRYETTPQTIPDNLFDTGAIINVTAAGGPDVAAFSGSVTAPAALAGYTPPAAPISRANGITLTWTAGAGPQIWVYMVGLTQQHIRFVICRVNDTGTYTLTPANLMLIPPTATTNEMIGFAVGRNALTQVTIPGGNVDIFAMSAVITDATLAP
jgi:hypothetical protein